MKLNFLIILLISILGDVVKLSSSSESKPKNIALLGDWGSVSGNIETARLIDNGEKILDLISDFHSKDKVDYVFAVGDAMYLDLAYGRGDIAKKYKKKLADGTEVTPTMINNKENLQTQVNGVMDELVERLKPEMFTDPDNRNFWNVLGNHDCIKFYQEQFINWRPNSDTFKYEIKDKDVMTKSIVLDDGKTVIVHFLNFCILSLLPAGDITFDVTQENKLKKTVKVPDIYTESNYHNGYWNKTESLEEYVNLKGDTMIQLAKDYLEHIEQAFHAAKADPNLAWQIVVMHNTLFSEGAEHGDSRQMKTHLLPLFYKYNIDLVINGHEHISQFSTVKKGQILKREDMKKPRSSGAMFFHDLPKDIEKLSDSDPNKIKARELIELKTYYDKFGDTEVTKCKDLYQVGDDDGNSEGIKINSDEVLSNILIGATEGRGIAEIGRDKNTPDPCKGDKIISGNGQLSQANVHYVNSRYYVWCSMTVTSSKIVLKYHHIDKEIKLTEKVFTANLNKYKSKLKKLRKTYLK